MSDGWMVVTALAAFAGALAARPVPVGIGAVAIALAFALRRRELIVVGTGLLASGLAAAAWAGLRPPRPAPVRARVTLVADPKVGGVGTRVDVRLGQRRVQLPARGS